MPGVNTVPMVRRIMSDQLTPVLAYRRLVERDTRLAPSFLFESVVGGDRIGRYSFLGANPVEELVAYDRRVVHRVHESPNGQATSKAYEHPDPLAEIERITRNWTLPPRERLPMDIPLFTGGWVGYAGYDTVRYLEGEQLPNPPEDDRHLPDLHMQLYRQVIAFDNARKAVVLITNVRIADHKSVDDAYASGVRELDDLVQRIETPRGSVPELSAGELDLSTPARELPPSNMGVGGYQKAVRKAKQYIGAGDIFQVVPSQRFELRTKADPFDIYRSLRVLNPSPYMFYLQVEGAVLVGSSPEILCRVQDGVVTNRPLAGTRKRGQTPAEDAALERELLDDPKERAEHIMLVDLGRNDVGRVCQPGTIELPEVMTVERYSHVMHISSTVTGRLREGKTCWDALRYALPVGTVSGAPKVRAMQIIDELEPTRRGPYAGAVGYADLAGNMDMAIALRTMVVLPRDSSHSATADYWTVHIQAGGGIVADSDEDMEHQETLNKSAAMATAVALAERAFG
ncbi:MAG: anthranilate synthase component I [Phycisphaera sp.]|nr:anthranilate synthase component I [Phycisphaera sp.]